MDRVTKSLNLQFQFGKFVAWCSLKVAVCGSLGDVAVQKLQFVAVWTMWQFKSYSLWQFGQCGSSKVTVCVQFAWCYSLQVGSLKQFAE